MSKLIFSRYASLLWVLIVLALMTGCATVPETRVLESLCAERTVFVGGLGNDENEPRFRLLLEQSLRESGFSVVRSREKADLIISGILKVERRRVGLFGERLVKPVFATINVETAQRVIWTIDSPPPRGSGDHLAIQARKVANEVVEACGRRWK